METKTKSSVGVVAELFTSIPSDVKKMYNIKMQNGGKDMIIAHPSYIVIKDWDVDTTRFVKGLSMEVNDYVYIATKHLTIVLDDQKVDMQIVLH